MILMIDNYDSFTYNLVQALRSFGREVRVVKNDEIDVEGIAALAPEAIVLSPGPGNPDSAGVTLAAVRAFAGKVPLLGICLGHQSIAQAFGAKVRSRFIDLGPNGPDACGTDRPSRMLAAEMRRAKEDYLAGRIMFQPPSNYDRARMRQAIESQGMLVTRDPVENSYVAQCEALAALRETL